MASVKPSVIQHIDTDDDITGTAILDDGRMLISKNMKRSLVMIDGEGEELSSLSMDKPTWGIRMISPTQGAVVVYCKCLQFFSVNNNKIVRGDALNVPIMYDFAFYRDHYYIGCAGLIMVYNSSFRHERARDIAVSGNVRSIAIRDDTSLCYTVDQGRELYCITMDGERVFTYSHDMLKDTTGVTVDNTGYIYVCGYISKNVHQLSHHGNLRMIIFDNLISYPYNVSFNTQEDNVVIGAVDKVLLYALK